MNIETIDYAWLLLILHTLLAVGSAGHALLYKRDPRAALGWIAVCLAYPIIGPILYYMFGINRLRTHAYQLKGAPLKRLKNSYERGDTPTQHNNTYSSPTPHLDQPELIALARSSSAVTHRPLLEGNAWVPYFDGESTYEAMIQAIHDAEHSVCLASYIFETNHSGRAFITALQQARSRGIQVRVLLDGFGELYSFPRAGSLMRKHGLKIARFVPPRLIPPSLHINLRNHRKLLVVDGHTGFTGGMNIGDRHIRQPKTGLSSTVDVHFQLKGPVVQQLQSVFDEDWMFATGENFTKYRQQPPACGNAVCRVITDGPNEDLGKLAMIITSAVALARKRVAIMTPYFLPPPALVNSLQAAALRGVQVDIILPRKSNQLLVQWATHNMLWELLQFGVRVYFQPPPFAHSKLLMIDDCYAHIGSANLDPRSLRLNFELVVEIFDRDFIARMSQHFNTIKQQSSEESLANVDARSLPVRIRDAAAWLFSPYL